MDTIETLVENYYDFLDKGLLSIYLVNTSSVLLKTRSATKEAGKKFYGDFFQDLHNFTATYVTKVRDDFRFKYADILSEHEFDFRYENATQLLALLASGKGSVTEVEELLGLPDNSTSEFDQDELPADVSEGSKRGAYSAMRGVTAPAKVENTLKKSKAAKQLAMGERSVSKKLLPNLHDRDSLFQIRTLLRLVLRLFTNNGNGFTSSLLSGAEVLASFDAFGCVVGVQLAVANGTDILVDVSVVSDPPAVHSVHVTFDDRRLSLSIATDRPANLVKQYRRRRGMRLLTGSTWRRRNIMKFFEAR